MPRYIDADALYRDTEKRIAESHQARMAVVDDEFLDLINDAYVDEDVVEVVRCKDCDVPHNRWTGCPNLNGMIPPPDFYCAKGKQKQQDAAAANPDAQRAAMHMESFSLFCPKCQKEYEEFMKGGESDDRRRKAD